MTDALPTGLDHVATSAPDEVDCEESSDVVTCTTDRSLGVGDEFTIEVEAQVTAPSGTRIVNTATVEGGNEVAGSPLPAEVLDQLATQSEDSAGADVEAANSLPFTGSNSATLAWLAVLLILAGASALLLRARLAPML